MRKKSRHVLFFIIVLAFVFCQASGCGAFTDYSGISIGNKAGISETIRDAMMARAYRVKVSYDAWTFDREKIEEAVAELVEGALYESADPKGGDYLRFQYGGYTLTHSVEKGLFKYKYRTLIVPHYYTTAEQEEEVDREIAEVIADFGFSAETPEIEKIRRVHDFICERTAYDTVHKHQGSSHIQSTAYGALIYRTALCQGYAVLACRLLKELGVECRVVTGEAFVDGERERHAWNIVRLGGVFYNMDVTLDDANNSYDWFMKTDETFASDHLREEKYLSDTFTLEYPMSREDYAN